jgi:hypothetical protein
MAWNSIIAGFEDKFRRIARTLERKKKPEVAENRSI